LRMISGVAGSSSTVRKASSVAIAGSGECDVREIYCTTKSRAPARKKYPRLFNARFGRAIWT
jgi:hypothetical protein